MKLQGAHWKIVSSSDPCQLRLSLEYIRAMSDILSGKSSDSCSGIQTDIFTDILYIDSDMYTFFLTVFPTPDVYSSILSDILSRTDLASYLTKNVLYKF